MEAVLFTDFNMYIRKSDYYGMEWKEEDIKGIKMSRNKDIKTLSFADDQVIVADSEDALQISIHKLETSTSKIWSKNFNKQNEDNGF